MYFEHIIYSLALAIIVGIVFERYTGTNDALLIVPISLIPDIDHFNNVLWDYGIIPWYTYIIPYLTVGMLHSFAALVVISLIVAFILNQAMGMKVWYALIYAAIGYAAHLFEDYIVYFSIYPIWYPFTSKLYGIGLIPQTGDLIIAGSRVIALGFLLLVIAIGVRQYCESNGWTVYVNGEEE